MDQVCENETKKQENEPSVPVLFAQEVLTQNVFSSFLVFFLIYLFNCFYILKQ